MIYQQPVLLDRVPGDATGIELPAHAEAMRAMGADFLTRAFHAYGSLAPQRRVARITRFEPCVIGSTGQKLLLSVEYDRPSPELATELFVKFSRNFNDGFRDRRRGELESEIRFGCLCRHPEFPVSAPVVWFGDFHHATGTGLLITQLIPFGRDGIEPLHHKCMDQELADPLAHYRTIVAALARLAAAHKAGRLAPQVDALFPFDAGTAAAEDPIPWTEAQLRDLIARYAAFASDHPQLLPAHVATRSFMASFETDAVAFLRHQHAVRRFLQADRRYIALTHFNPNIDNAWFWRDAAGVLQCGLFDWQRARQMNVAYALWGGLCCASLEIWDQHLDELLALFIGELDAHGGPLLDRDELKLHIGLYAALIGLAGLMEMPRLVTAYLPEAGTAAGPRDPLFARSESARSFLHVFTSMVNLWQTHDLGASLARVLARSC